MSDIAVNYMILRDSIVLNFESQNFTVQKDTDQYNTVLELIRSDNLSAIPNVIQPSALIKAYIPEGEFVVHNGAIYSDGELVSGYIGERLLEFAKNDLPYHYLLCFWKRVKNNPSANSKDQLYRFLEKTKCPITQDGMFIAYKSVTKNMEAHYDKSVVYTLGESMCMERKDVVDDPNEACGPGLHVGSYEYASNFNSYNSLILEVSVDPVDVVSVPVDCSSGKLRACKITPINICKAEYDTSIIADDEGDAVDISASNIEEDVYVINRMKYMCTAIDDNEFEKIVHNNTYGKQLTRVRPSKAPKSIREQFSIKICYRYVPNKNAAPVYVLCTDNDEFMKFETQAAFDKNKKVVAKKAKKETKIFAEVIIARKPHNVFKLSSDKGHSILEKQTLHIRPSKYPVGIKKMFPDAKLCKRVVNTEKSEYIVQDVNDIFYTFIEK